MNLDRLVEIGLTRREAQAYVALLGLKEASAGEVARFSHEDRTNIYDSLSGLVKKGLASCIVKGKTKRYRAAPPERLGAFVAEKKHALEEILSELSGVYRSDDEKPIVHAFEGTEGIKTVLSDIISEGKEICALGAVPKILDLVPEFAKRHLIELERRGIAARHVHGGKGCSPRRLTRCRVAPKDLLGPAATVIYGDSVAILVHSAPPISVLIKSREAAETWRKYFEFVWKHAKPRGSVQLG